MLFNMERQFGHGLAIGALACLMLIFVAPAVLSGETYSPGQVVKIEVVDLPLRKVVELLVNQTAGLNLVMATTQEEAERKISAHVDGQPLEKVLKDILTAAGVKFRKTDEGTYLIGVGEDAASTAAPAASSLSTSVAVAPPPKRKVRTEVIKLRYSDPRAIVDILNAEEPPPGEWSWQLNDENGHLLPPKLGGALDIPGVHVAEPVPPTQDGNLPKLGTGEAGRTASDLSTAGQAPYPPTRPSGFTPRSTATSGATATSTGAGTSLRPDGIELVTGYAIDNSLIVRGTEEGIEELRNLIYLLDISPRQVEIEAEFIEVSTNVVNRFGMDWNLERLNRSFSTNFNPSGNVVIGFATGNLTAAIRAELTSGKGRIINAPKISTINNMYAEIAIQTQIPVFIRQVVATGDGAVSGEGIMYKNIDTGLSVTPRINGDDSITMMLTPRITDQGRIHTSPEGNEVPETRSQMLTANRRVQNGETIVVGGFIRRTEESGFQRVPILSNLPFIGGLFKTKSHQEDDSELLIFITPRIIPDPVASAAGGPRI